jgi:hypothetical protein
MLSYHVRFRNEQWWIVYIDNWYGPYREIEMAQSLAIEIARRAAELSVPTSVVVHHKDTSVETVWDGRIE